MIIFTACDGKNNIVQLIIGPQTELQFNMLGSIKIDLNELLKRFQKDLPLKMILTSTSDEFRTIDLLENSSNDGTTPIIKYDDSESETWTEVSPDGGKQIPHEPKKNIKQSTPKPQMDPRGIYMKDIICPGCKTEGVYIKKQMPPYCADCLKIELGLGNITEDKPKKITNKKPSKK